MKKNKVTRLAVFATMILLAMGIVSIAKRQITISISTEEIGYIVCYHQGLGPRRLDYLENKDYLDQFFDMISGEYHYLRTWSNRGRDGGGPSLIHLYGEEGNLIETIRYADGLICTSAWIKGIYYLYRQENNAVSFYDFDEYLNLHGKVI